MKELTKYRKRIEEAYLNAMSASSEKGFYIGVFNYLNIFDGNKFLETIIKNHIINVEKEDKKTLDELEKKSIGEIKKVFTKTEAYIKKQGVTDERITKEIESYKMILAGQRRTSDGILGGLSGDTVSILRYLLENKDEHMEFLKHYGVFDETGSLTRWSFFIQRDKYDEEKERLERIQHLKIWYYWNKLAFLYNLNVIYEKMRKSLWDDRRFMDLMGINHAYGELKEILEGRKPKERWYFKFEENKEDLKHLHFFMKTVFEELEGANTNEPTAKIDMTYNKEERELTINGKAIDFKESKRSDLLEFLLQKKTKVNVEDAVKRIFGESFDNLTSRETELYKKKVYDYAEKINIRIMKKTGIADFIVYNKNSSRINSKYLR